MYMIIYIVKKIEMVVKYKMKIYVYNVKKDIMNIKYKIIKYVIRLIIMINMKI